MEEKGTSKKSQSLHIRDKVGGYTHNHKSFLVLTVNTAFDANTSPLAFSFDNLAFILCTPLLVTIVTKGYCNLRRQGSHCSFAVLLEAE